jgi:hypothetical protein
MSHYLTHQFAALWADSSGGWKSATNVWVINLILSLKDMKNSIATRSVVAESVKNYQTMPCII